MQCSSLSAFLDSFENPSASHVVFWMAGRSSSPAASVEAPMVQRRVDWEAGEEESENNGVKVHVQKLLSSSALDEATSLQPIINTTSVKSTSLSGDQEPDFVSPGSLTPARAKSEILLRSLEPSNQNEADSKRDNASTDAKGTLSPEEAHSCFTEFSDYNLDSESPQPWEMANAPSFNSSIGGPLEVHPEVSERTETDRIYTDADLGSSEMFYSDALDDLGRSKTLEPDSVPPSERNRSDAEEPDFGASDLIYSDTLEEILDASLRIDEVLAEIEIEHGKPELEAQKNGHEKRSSPKKDASPVAPRNEEETEQGSAGAHTESTHAESDTSLPHATSEPEASSAYQHNLVDPTQPEGQKEMGKLDPTSAKAPKPADTDYNSCKPINSSAEKSHKDNTFNNWKLIPPSHREGEEMVVDGTTWYWCTKCARGKFPGRWSNTHGTSGHTGRVIAKRARGQATSSSTRATAQGEKGEETQAKHKRKLPVASERKAQPTKYAEEDNAEPFLPRVQASSTNDEEEEKVDALLPTVEACPQNASKSQTQPTRSLPGTPNSVEQIPAALPLSPASVQSALAGSEPFTPPNFSLSSLFASPASSLGERVPLEPHFEEIPMLLLNEMQKECSSDVARALEALGELLEKSRRNSGNMAHRLGAHSIVLLAMRKHHGIEDVQAWGCRCLGLLGSLHPETTLAIILLGGLEVLLNAMNRFPTTVSVQRNACNTLLSMFYCIQSQMATSRIESQVASELASTPTAVISQQEGTAILDRFVNEMHGPKILMRSMRKCLMVVRVLSPCCGIFSILAKAGHQKALKDAGTVSAVAVALENNPKDEELNRYATEFMVTTFAAYVTHASTLNTPVVPASSTDSL